MLMLSLPFLLSLDFCTSARPQKTLPTCSDRDGPLHPFAAQLPEDRFSSKCGIKLMDKERVAWGYVTSSGCVAIAPQFEAAGPFVDGLAIVALGQVVEESDRWGVGVTYGAIDASGALVVPADYLRLSEFVDGYATGIVSEESETSPFPEKNGYFVDREGKRHGNAQCGVQMTPSLSDCAQLEGGLSFQRPQRTLNQWAEILDTATLADFKAEIESVFGSIDADTPFSAGNTPGQYLNAKGQPAFDGWFTQGCAFSEGLACATPLGQQALIYIDSSGKQAFEGQYTSGSDFSDGHAVVQQGDTTTVIDKQGKTVFTPPGSAYGPFHDGLLQFSTVVEDARNFGFVNAAGEVVVKPEHTEVATPASGRIAVGAGEKFGMPQWRFLPTTAAPSPTLEAMAFAGYGDLSFHNGVARVQQTRLLETGTHGERVDGNYVEKPGEVVNHTGLVSEAGTWVVEPSFEWQDGGGMMFNGKALCEGGW